MMQYIILLMGLMGIALTLLLLKVPSLEHVDQLLWIS